MFYFALSMKGDIDLLVYHGIFTNRLRDFICLAVNIISDYAEQSHHDSNSDLLFDDKPH